MNAPNDNEAAGGVGDDGGAQRRRAAGSSRWRVTQNEPEALFEGAAHVPYVPSASTDDEVRHASGNVTPSISLL